MSPSPLLMYCGQKKLFVIWIKTMINAVVFGSVDSSLGIRSTTSATGHMIDQPDQCHFS